MQPLLLYHRLCQSLYLWSHTCRWCMQRIRQRV